MGAAEKFAERLPFWPEGMGWDMACTYTGVGEAQMRNWQKRGLVRFKASGPKGALVTTKVQLDAALQQHFALGGDLSEDWDFGD